MATKLTHSTLASFVLSSSAKPTTAQLANIAAVLWTSKKKPDALVKDALAIWDAAHELLTSVG